MSQIKTMPLNQEMLDHQSPEVFFTQTLPARQPPGKFYVIGRHYIARSTPGGTLVLFHYQGQMIVCARLQPEWYQQNDDPDGNPDAVAIYLLEDIAMLPTPLSVNQLPTAWQAHWSGKFDQNPRSLDGAHEAEFRKLAALS